MLQCLWSNITTVLSLMLYRSLPPMDQLQRLKRNLAVVRHLARRGRHLLLESANMLVRVRRLLQVRRNSQAHQNSAQTVCVAVIGCRKSQSLCESFSLRLLLVKGSKRVTFANYCCKVITVNIVFYGCLICYTGEL